MKSNEKACLTVFSQRMAADLMKCGHRLIEMKPDRKFPDRNVFFFLNKEEVRNDIEKLKAEYTK